MKAAMIQMDMELGKPDENFEKAVRMTEEACALNPDVVILPETWNVGFFPRENLDKLSDRDCSRVKETFSSLSKTYAVNVIAGSVANRKADGNIYNTACVFDRKGNLTAQYDKVHLFSPSGEDDFFQCGDRPCNLIRNQSKLV